jgi:hypothetical protein
MSLGAVVEQKEILRSSIEWRLVENGGVVVGVAACTETESFQTEETQNHLPATISKVRSIFKKQAPRSSSAKP